MCTFMILAVGVLYGKTATATKFRTAVVTRKVNEDPEYGPLEMWPAAFLSLKPGYFHVISEKRLAQKDFPPNWDTYMYKEHGAPCKYQDVVKNLVKWDPLEKENVSPKKLRKGKRKRSDASAGLIDEDAAPLVDPLVSITAKVSKVEVTAAMKAQTKHSQEAIKALKAAVDKSEAAIKAIPKDLTRRSKLLSTNLKRR